MRTWDFESYDAADYLFQKAYIDVVCIKKSPKYLLGPEIFDTERQNNRDQIGGVIGEE